MARLARAEIFDPAEIVALHLIGKTVRSCYLMGFDERSGKNFDHRKRQSWNDLGPFDQLLSDLQVAEVAKTFGFGGHQNSWRVPLRQ